MFVWNIGIVTKILEQNNKLQIVEVSSQESTSSAIHYLKHFPQVKIGDQVLLNKTATSLNLGTGGYDFVIIPFTVLNQRHKTDLSKDQGHIMKLRYTPFQFSVLSCEEQESPYHELLKEKDDLKNLPVIIGELHSMLPILVTTFRQLELKYKQEPKKIVYIMTDGAALPIELSKNVTKLKQLGWLDATITIGHAYGGDLEAVNIYSGLLAAKYICQADFVIVLMGPGIVGTGTKFGHTGVEQGEIINAVSVIGGKPIAVVRASASDARGRHTGISHHSILNLKKISLRKSIIPYPKLIHQYEKEVFEGLKSLSKDQHKLIEVDLDHHELFDFLRAFPYPISTMGRGINEDPLFFDFVASASYLMFTYFQNSVGSPEA